MSGHPPFGLQISLNGHEWVKRQAQKQAISWVKEGNCFVGGSELAGLNRLAEQLTVLEAWRSWRTWWIVGCTRPGCVLRLTVNNKNVRGFATPIGATNWNTAEICCSKAGANLTKSIKGSLTARAECWTCLDSKP